MPRREGTDGRRKRATPGLGAAKTAAFPVCGFGPFRLLDRVDGGEGEALSEVYRALWTPMAGAPERPCLIKRLRAELTGSPTFVRMFEDEARVLAALDHPNITTTYAHGSIGDVPYVAIEAQGGVELGRLLRGRRVAGAPLPIEVALYIAHEIARALGHAHAVRAEVCTTGPLVHGRLAPSSIVLLDSGGVKLKDFGVPRVSSFLAQGFTYDGIPGGRSIYVAPEQVRGEVADARTDLFSLGVVLWEMLTGRPLFPPCSQSEGAARVLGAELPPPSTIRPEIPAALDALIAGLLDRERDRRYATAADLTRDLARFLPCPADDARAIASLVRAELAVTVPAPLPGSRRPVTSVLPILAKALTQNEAARLVGKLPGQIRRITRVVPVLAAKLPGRSAAGAAPPHPVPEARADAAAERYVPPYTRWSVFALQTAIAATVVFLAGFGWQQLRASSREADLPRLPALANITESPSAGVVIQPLAPPAQIVADPPGAVPEVAPAAPVERRRATIKTGKRRGARRAR